MYASVFSSFNFSHFSLFFIKSALVLILLLSNALAVFAYDGEVDLSYVPNLLRAGTGVTIEQQPDGKILVGGSFSSINGVSRTSVVRLNADGTLDQSFSAPSLIGNVIEICLQPDGKILVAGSNIFRLNPDGSTDGTFVSGLSITSLGIFSASLQADGKILVTGNFAPGIARLNSDGTRDTSFNVLAGQTLPPPYTVHPDIAALPDGEIILYGAFTTVNGVARSAMARLNNDGSLDTTFNAGLPQSEWVGSVALQADGKILAAVNGAGVTRVARFNPDGSLDTSFSAPLNSVADNVKARADGKIFISGLFTTINSTPRNYVAKLNADGSIDTSFNPNPNNRIYDILPSENPVIVGEMDQVNGIPHLGIARLDAAGNVDANFAVHLEIHGTMGKVFGLPDGKALVGGEFVRAGNAPISNLVRVNSDGSLDSSFNAAISLFSVSSFNVKIAANSRIGVCGGSNLISNGDDKKVVILNYDGSLDTSFNVNVTSGNVNDMAFYRNGKVLVAGSFRLGGETQTFTLAMLNADGMRDTSFTPTFTGAVSRVLAQSDGKFYAAGNFTTVNGIPRNNLVRFNADGSVDQTFDPNVSKFYNAQRTYKKMYVQPDGKLLVSGTFVRSSVFGNRNSYLIRLTPDGSLDSTFASPEAEVADEEFAVQSDGRILIIARLNRVFRLKQNGRYDYSFNFHARGALTASNLRGSLSSVAVQPDNRILVGGLFQIYNETSRFGLARLENAMLAPSTDFDFDVDGKSDLAVFRPSDTSWHILKSSNNSYSATPFGLSDDKLVPGDYDQDGITDFAVFRPSDGVWYILNSLTNQVTARRFGQSGDIPVPADYNDDGVIDFAVYRPSTGVWWILISDWRAAQNFTVLRATPFGAAGDIPTVGDFDGDGKSDIAVFRPSTGIWYRLNSFTNQFFAYQLGVEGDKPTPADYDGDSITDMSVYRPSNGTWYRLNSTGKSLTVVRFGLEEDNPVPADYDGDGKADIAVFRPSSGVWYQLRSTQGPNAHPFGTNGDVPVQNALYLKVQCVCTCVCLQEREACGLP